MTWTSVFLTSVRGGHRPLPSRGSAMWSFDLIFYINPNKLLNKQPSHRQLGTTRHACKAIVTPRVFPLICRCWEPPWTRTELTIINLQAEPCTLTYQCDMDYCLWWHDILHWYMNERCALLIPTHLYRSARHTNNLSNSDTCFWRYREDF